MIWELVGDLTQALRAVPKEHAGWPSLQVLCRALRLSSHVIASDHLALPAQLCGRLSGDEAHGIGRLLCGLKESRRAPWIRPLAPSLTSPAGDLVQTLAVLPACTTALAVSSDGRFASAGTVQGEVRLWDLMTGEELLRLDLDEGGAIQREVEAGTLGAAAKMVSLVALPVDGHRLISVLGVGRTDIWDFDTCRRMNHLHVDHPPLSVSRDGSRLLCADRFRGLVEYHLATGKAHYVVSNVASGGWLERAALADHRAILWWGSSGQCRVQVWDLQNGTLLQELPPRRDSPAALSIAASGRRAAVSCLHRSEGPLGVEIWDLERGECLHTVETKDQIAFPIVLSDDGAIMVYGTPDGLLHVWKEGREETVPAEGAMRETNEIDELTAPASGRTLALASDGRTLLSGSRDGTIRVWDLAASDSDVVYAGARISAVILSPDGRKLLSGSVDGTAEVWELPAAVRRVRLRRPARSKSEMLADNISRVFDNIMANKPWGEGVARADDSGKADRLAHRCAAKQAMFAPDGRCCMTVSEDHVRVWDSVSGQCVRLLEKGEFTPEVARLTPDGKRLLVAGVLPNQNPSPSCFYKSALAAWDLVSGQWCPLGEIAQATDTSKEPMLLELSPTGQRAIWGRRGTALQVWDVPTARLVCRFEDHTAWTEALAVSPDGVFVLCGDGSGRLRTYGLDRPDCLRVWEAHRKRISSIAFAPDARHAVSAGPDCTIRLWDVRDARCVTATGKLAAAVYRVCVTPDGRHVIGTTAAKELHVWRLPAFERLATYCTDELIEVLAVSEDGTRVALGDRSGRVHPVALENLAAGPLLVSAWSAGDGTRAFGCPSCRTWVASRSAHRILPGFLRRMFRSVLGHARDCVWIDWPESARGQTLKCPKCRISLKLNAYVLNADWRPVAASWRTHGG